MGVVLSPEAVRAGRYPHKDAHDAIAVYALDELGAFCEQLQWRQEPEVVVIVHGSVAEGRANLTSDLDICVILGKDFANSPRHAQLHDKITELMRIAAEEYFVPVEVKVVDKDTLGTGRQNDPSFYHYLAGRLNSIHRKWFRGNAIPMHLAPYDRPPLVEDVVTSLRGYFASKEQSMQQPTVQAAELLKKYQRALELPDRGLQKIGYALMRAGLLAEDPGEIELAMQGELFDGEFDTPMQKQLHRTLQEQKRKAALSAREQAREHVEGIDVGVRRHMHYLRDAKYEGIALLDAVYHNEKRAQDEYDRWFAKVSERSIHSAAMCAEAMRGFVEITWPEST